MWTTAMAKPRNRIKFKRGALKKIRTSPEAMAAVQKRARKIADACGPGFGVTAVEITKGRGRARIAVMPVTPNARKKNARDHTIMRNLSAGRE